MPGTEMFYKDGEGVSQDADLQEPILAEGDEKSVVAATRARLAADGTDEATLTLLYGAAD